MHKPILFSNINLSLNSKEIIDKLDLQKDDIVYISGSLVEGIINKNSKGLGNKRSDLDVFIIRKHDEFLNTIGEYEEKIRKTTFLTSSGIGFDIEIFDHQFVSEIINELSNSEIVSNKRILNCIKLPDGWKFSDLNEFFTRIKNSICLYNQEEYNIIIKKIDFNKFMDIYKYHLINIIDNVMDDVVGNAEQQEMLTALICAREMAFDLMSVILIAKGEMCDRKKWIWIKFTNVISGDRNYKKLFDTIKKIMFSKLKEEEIIKEINNFLSITEEYIQDISIGDLL